MNISDRLLCLFSGQVEKRDGTYRIEIPERELRLGDIEADGTYQVALVATPDQSTESQEPATTEAAPASVDEPVESQQAEYATETVAPPIEPGETRLVDIEGLGDQGDGITRVERGFVVIVPDTEKGDRVRIEITDVRETVAFADVIERLDYYE